MLLVFVLYLTVQVFPVFAAPSSNIPTKGVHVLEALKRLDTGAELSVAELIARNKNKVATTVTTTVTVAATAAAALSETTATPATVAEDAGEEEEEEEAKTRTNGTLAQAVLLKGANELQAVSFFGSAGIGALEVEYQNAESRTLTVTENQTPAAAPAGFKFIDTSSYVVALLEGTTNVTRQQIDYTFTLTNAAVKAVNVSAVRTGKLCTEAKAFVISDALGTQDFEADEGESKFVVTDMNGEWAVFVPIV